MVTVFRGALDITRREIESLARICRGGQTVFNPDPDPELPGRIQTKLRSDRSVLCKLRGFLEARGLMEGRRLGESVLLYSRKGCVQQQWHRDYDSSGFARLLHKPLGVLVALQSGTKFKEYPCTTHTLGAGDVLVFEGDVPHAGAGYDHENMRIHAYVHSVEMQTVPGNTTFLLSDDDNQDTDIPW